MSARKLWEGNADLKRRLVPVGDLRTHPKNARRGDLDVIASSLERFGQQRAGLATPDGTIVAGNHSFMAARDRLGWTHWAVDHSDLTDEEAIGYLIVDNRSADLGTYDLPMLASLIAPFADNLAGIGFTAAEYDELLTSAAGVPTPDAKPVAPKTDAVQTLFLAYPADQYEQTTRWLGMVAREWNLDIAATVHRLAKEAAANL